MAACTFYQNALLASRVNEWIKMTRNHLMMKNFSTTKKLTSCLMPVLQKTSIRFSKRFPTAMHSGKILQPPSFSLWWIPCKRHASPPPVTTSLLLNSHLFMEHEMAFQKFGQDKFLIHNLFKIIDLIPTRKSDFSGKPFGPGSPWKDISIPLIKKKIHDSLVIQITTWHSRVTNEAKKYNRKLNKFLSTFNPGRPGRPSCPYNSFRA